MWSIDSQSVSALLERRTVPFTLFSLLVSTAALVDRKIKGLTYRQTFATQSVEVSDVRAGVTNYVAVIATMPPTAPAKEWIVESPGIVKGCEGDGGDSKQGLERLPFDSIQFTTSDVGSQSM